MRAAASRAARLRALEYQHRRPEPEQALWLGWPGWWLGPGGEQQAEPPSAGRVIVLRWGDKPDNQPLADQV